MKKLISVLLAVSTLVLSTSALAAPAVTNRNPVAEELAVATTGNLPCFRNGDAVAFELSGLTDDQLTLISYKAGDDATDSTIQYINQYAHDGAVRVSYDIRNLTDGTYNIRIKDGDAAVVEYFYNVANPSVALLTTAKGSPVIADDGNGTVAFAAQAKVEGASFTEAGVSGATFTLNGKLVPNSISAATLDEIADELTGARTAVYGIVVGNTNGDTITPTAVLNDAE